MATYRRGSQRGQGLAEYALIFALVAIAVIVLLAVTGQKVGEALCDVVIKIGAKVPPNIAMCAAPRVTISGLAGGQIVNGSMSVEALIQDDKIDQPNDIQYVDFYIDTTRITHQQYYHYCLHGGGSDGCLAYATDPLSNGQHTLRVVAEDIDHNIGQTTLTFSVAH